MGTDTAECLASEHSWQLHGACLKLYARVETTPSSGGFLQGRAPPAAPPGAPKAWGPPPDAHWVRPYERGHIRPYQSAQRPARAARPRNGRPACTAQLAAQVYGSQAFLLALPSVTHMVSSHACLQAALPQSCVDVRHALCCRAAAGSRCSWTTGAWAAANRRRPTGRRPVATAASTAPVLLEAGAWRRRAAAALEDAAAGLAAPMAAAAPVTWAGTPAAAGRRRQGGDTCDRLHRLFSM